MDRLSYGLPCGGSSALCAGIAAATAGSFTLAGIDNHPYQDEGQRRKDDNANHDSSGILP